MKHRLASILLASGALALLLGSSSIVASEPSAAAKSRAAQRLPTERFALGQHIGWLNEAVWRSDNQLLLVDRGRNQLLELSLHDDGRAVLELAIKPGRVQSTELESHLKRSPPVLLRRFSPNTLVLQTKAPSGEPRRLLLLDNDLSIRDSIVVPTEVADGWRMVGLWNWIALPGKKVLAYVDLQHEARLGSDGEPLLSSGFVYFPGGQGSILFEVRRDSSLRKYFVESRDYLATVGRKIAILLPIVNEDEITSPKSSSNRAEVLILDADSPLGKQAVLQLPSSLGTLPDLHDLVDMRPGPRSATEYYRRVQKARTPLALFACDESLYVLSKSALQTDQTQWALAKLSLEVGGWEQPKPLLSSAANLTLVPGNPKWAIIEKAPVEPTGPNEAALLRIEGVRLQALN